MKDRNISRRDFLKGLGVAGGTLLAATSPWLKAFSDVEATAGGRLRVGIIGPGSRGRFLLGFVTQNPKADVVAMADIYQPSIDEAKKIIPHATPYHDYRRLLDDSRVQAVIIATPLSTHYQIARDAIAAGKDVYCEKTLCYGMDECHSLYMQHLASDRIFFTGQQRLFDPRYIRAMQLIHDGLIGKVTAIHAYWNRNGDWRRPVPDPRYEQLVNWRLYTRFSKGLMTELACHQLQVGTWALGKLPRRVMGTGAITFWDDGRQVEDNLNCIYQFPGGEQMTYASDIANKFYGLEEQILGSKGTMEPEKGKYYMEDIAPAPAFLQLANSWEHALFDEIPFAGTSWAPETANENNGEYIMGKRPKTDGTSLALDAWVEACMTRRQPPRIMEEGYYASLLALWGYEAIRRGEPMDFPKQYLIDYPTYGTTAAADANGQNKKQP